MKNPQKLKFLKSPLPGQTAIEYLLLLSAVVAVVLVALRTIMPNTVDYANVYFNRVSYGVMGEPAGLSYERYSQYGSYGYGSYGSEWTAGLPRKSRRNRFNYP